MLGFEAFVENIYRDTTVLYYMYTPMLKSVLIACSKGWRVHANNHVSIIARSTRVELQGGRACVYRKGVRCIDRV